MITRDIIQVNVKRFAKGSDVFDAYCANEWHFFEEDEVIFGDDIDNERNAVTDLIAYQVRAIGSQPGCYRSWLDFELDQVAIEDALDGFFVKTLPPYLDQWRRTGVWDKDPSCLISDLMRTPSDEASFLVLAEYHVSEPGPFSDDLGGEVTVTRHSFTTMREVFSQVLPKDPEARDRREYVRLTNKLAPAEDQQEATAEWLQETFPRPVLDSILWCRKVFQNGQYQTRADIKRLVACLGLKA